MAHFLALRKTLAVQFDRVDVWVVLVEKTTLYGMVCWIWWWWVSEGHGARSSEKKRFNWKSNFCGWKISNRFSPKIFYFCTERFPLNYLQRFFTFVDERFPLNSLQWFFPLQLISRHIQARKQNWFPTIQIWYVTCSGGNFFYQKGESFKVIYMIQISNWFWFLFHLQLVFAVHGLICFLLEPINQGDYRLFSIILLGCNFVIIHGDNDVS